MEIDKTKNGWMLVVCLLINGPPPASDTLENLPVHDDYRRQILDWYCRIKGLPPPSEFYLSTRPGKPLVLAHPEAKSWTNYYMAWYRNTKQEKDDD